jgi:membrane dipeptidase
VDDEAAKESGRLGICFDLEGGSALGGQVSMIALYHRLGVRWMVFAYNRNNEFAGGCLDNDEGLTKFGRQVLQEMARVGMVACCSHAGYRRAREIIDSSPNSIIRRRLVAPVPLADRLDHLDQLAEVVLEVAPVPD